MNKKVIAAAILLSVVVASSGGIVYEKVKKQTVVVGATTSEKVIEQKVKIKEKNINERKTVKKSKEGMENPRKRDKAKQKANEVIDKTKIESKPVISTQIVNVDIAKLNKQGAGWYYQIRTDGTPSGEPREIKDLIEKYSAYYLGDTSDKNIYLTFDEGYEEGYTNQILDTLKANDVKAAFFVTTSYVNSGKDLVKRMVKEGHLVCNHSTTHPSMPTIIDEAKFNNEILSCEKAFEAVTGARMGKYFRPPMGNYSELSLYYTKKLGYKTIFWSFAYEDWDTENQPSHEYAKKIIMERTHGGGIYLLHANSKTNTEILDSLIKEWKSKGFKFKSLNEASSKK